MIWTIIGVSSAVGFICYLLILAAYEKGRSDAHGDYITEITDKDYPPVERRRSVDPIDII